MPRLPHRCTSTTPTAEDPSRARYGPRVAKWMEYFNSDQLMMLQYESLISKGPSMAENLQASCVRKRWCCASQVYILVCMAGQF